VDRLWQSIRDERLALTSELKQVKTIDTFLSPPSIDISLHIPSTERKRIPTSFPSPLLRASGCSEF